MMQYLRSSALAALLIAFATCQPAATQPYPLHHFGAPAAELVTAGFSGPYGQKFAAVITALIKDSAAPGCSPPQLLAARVDAILQMRGTQIVDILSRRVAAVTFRDAVAARLGSGALDEFETLKGNPVVQEYVALAAPQRAATTVNMVTQHLGSFLINRRIELVREFPKWFAKSHPELAEADPSMPIAEKMDAFQEQAKSPHLDRYAALTFAAQDILDALFQQSPMGQSLDPAQIAGGFEVDLADLCVKVR